MTAPESTLSIRAATKEVLQAKYTLSPNYGVDLFHPSVVRKKLTRQTPKLLEEILDELEAVLTEIIPLTDGKQSFMIYISLFLSIT